MYYIFILFSIVVLITYIFVAVLFFKYMTMSIKLDKFIKNNKNKEIDETKRYIICAESNFCNSIQNRDAAIEKMSQVQLVLDKDKIYKRTILK